MSSGSLRAILQQPSSACDGSSSHFCGIAPSASRLALCLQTHTSRRLSTSCASRGRVARRSRRPLEPRSSWLPSSFRSLCILRSDFHRITTRSWSPQRIRPSALAAMMVKTNGFGRLNLRGEAPARCRSRAARCYRHAPILRNPARSLLDIGAEHLCVRNDRAGGQYTNRE
jgi:hypothetical protein